MGSEAKRDIRTGPDKDESELFLRAHATAKGACESETAFMTNPFLAADSAMIG